METRSNKLIDLSSKREGGTGLIQSMIYCSSSSASGGSYKRAAESLDRDDSDETLDRQGKDEKGDSSAKFVPQYSCIFGFE